MRKRGGLGEEKMARIKKVINLFEPIENIGREKSQRGETCRGI